MGIPYDLLSHLESLLQPLRNRIANTLLRGAVSLVNDSKKMRLVQVTIGEQVIEGDEGAEHFEPYGFTSVPLRGAEAIVLLPNGDSGHPIVPVIADRRHRPTGGEPGEVVIYTDEGDQIRLARLNRIILSTSGQVHLGSIGADQPAIKGVTRNTAEQTFLTALDTFAAAIVAGSGVPAPAKVAFAAAVAAFKAALPGTLSSKVLVE